MSEVMKHLLILAVPAYMFGTISCVHLFIAMLNTIGIIFLINESIDRKSEMDRRSREGKVSPIESTCPENLQQNSLKRGTEDQNPLFSSENGMKKVALPVLADSTTSADDKDRQNVETSTSLQKTSTQNHSR